MKTETYQRLRLHLDSLPVGYPETKSGVELRILERLFTEEEAEIVCFLSLEPEGVERIAGRVGKSYEQTSKLLYEISRKGLVFRMKKEGKLFYSASQFVVGIYEYNVKNLDRELAGYFEAYLHEKLGKELYRADTPQLRTIPVATSLDFNFAVETYDDIRKIIEQQSIIVITDCICRKEKTLIGQPCNKPLETCLWFSWGARYAIENGFGKEISRDETFELLKKNESAGLVLSPGNSQRAGALCSCCGCCCAILQTIKKFPSPAKLIKSNYFAEVNEECMGCEICLDRCQMEAIRYEEGAIIDLNRCIGCGLCVSTCPAGAIHLVPKDESYLPPKNWSDTYFQMAKERGKFPGITK